MAAATRMASGKYLVKVFLGDAGLCVRETHIQVALEYNRQLLDLRRARQRHGSLSNTGLARECSTGSQPALYDFSPSQNQIFRKNDFEIWVSLAKYAPAERTLSRLHDSYCINRLGQGIPGWL